MSKKSKLSVVSAEHRPDNQLRLFEEPVTIGTSRVVCGDFFEEATKLATGAVRLRTSTRSDICPDIAYWLPLCPAGVHNELADYYFEIKSVGRGGKSAQYERRILKDKRFLQENPDTSLVYWFWRHRVLTTECEFPSTLRKSLAEQLQEVFVIGANELHSLLEQIPLRYSRTVEKGNGWGSEGYADYRNLGIKDLRTLTLHEGRSPEVQVYKNVVKSVPAFFSQSVFEVFFNGQ